jgi:hypothetical protein
MRKRVWELIDESMQPVAGSKRYDESRRVDEGTEAIVGGNQSERACSSLPNWREPSHPSSLADRQTKPDERNVGVNRMLPQARRVPSKRSLVGLVRRREYRKLIDRLRCSLRLAGSRIVAVGREIQVV